MEQTTLAAEHFHSGVSRQLLEGLITVHNRHVSCLRITQHYRTVKIHWAAFSYPSQKGALMGGDTGPDLGCRHAPHTMISTVTYPLGLSASASFWGCLHRQTMVTLSDVSTSAHREHAFAWIAANSL